MAATSTPVSLDEYLNTAYEPDRDFVDGVLLERNVGTQRHGLLQTFLILFFGQYIKSHRIALFTETRLRVDVTGRHRIPDVMIVELPYSQGKVVVDVPAIVVEIKSPWRSVFKPRAKNTSLMANGGPTANGRIPSPMASPPKPAIGSTTCIC